MSGHIDEELLPAAARACIFDVDGTVLDTMSTHWKSWKNACDKFGVKISVNDFRSHAGQPAPVIIRALCQRQGIEIDYEAFVEYKREWYSKSVSEIKPIQPVLAILREAQARGLKIGAASGGTTEHVMLGLQSTGLAEACGVIICAEDYENPKPSPDCFLMAAEKLGVAPEHCVGYEDAVLGMAAIRAAGFLAAVDVTLLPGYPQIDASAA